MKHLLSAVFAMALCTGSCHHWSRAEQAPVQNGHGQAESVRVAGKWKVSMDTPHGPMSGILEFKQDGSRISGTLDFDHGVLPFTGTVGDKKITFDVKMPGGGDQTIAFNGAVDGDKMNGNMATGGVWKATRQ